MRLNAPATVIGEKPVTRDAHGWLQIHPAYSGWVPEAGRSRSLLGHVLATLIGCAGAGALIVIERLIG